MTQPFIGKSLMKPGLHPAKYVVRGENHALLRYIHRQLVPGVPGHVDKLESGGCPGKAQASATGL